MKAWKRWKGQNRMTEPRPMGLAGSAFLRLDGRLSEIFPVGLPGSLGDGFGMDLVRLPRIFGGGDGDIVPETRTADGVAMTCEKAMKQPRFFHGVAAVAVLV